MDNVYSFYVGTYCSEEQDGIYLITMDRKTGELKLQQSVKGVKNPSFLTVDGQKRCLYSVSEIEEYEGKKRGAVVSFLLDPLEGKLTYQNKQLTPGGAPCFISIDDAARSLFIANYSGGNVCLFPIGADGFIEKMTDYVQHHGRGPRDDRQEAPHPHSVFLDPSNRYALVPDLGLDQIAVYAIDFSAGKFIQNGSVKLQPGAGPRHLVFHHSEPFVYCINELDSTISVFKFNQAAGSLDNLQTIATLPEGFTDQSTCADIHLSPDGSYLYGSNRGHDSIAIYKVDPITGLLTAAGHCSTGGKSPRNFAISPDGQFLLAANQKSDSIIVFKLNPMTGMLEETGHQMTVQQPVCIRFVE